jgi:hypothetical protein
VDSSKKKDDSDDEEEVDKLQKDKATATKAMLSALHKTMLTEKFIPLCSKARKVLLKHRPIARFSHAQSALCSLYSN